MPRRRRTVGGDAGGNDGLQRVAEHGLDDRRLRFRGQLRRHQCEVVAGASLPRRDEAERRRPGLVFVAIALVSDSVWGLAAGTARAWFARSPRRLRMVGGAGGLTMIGLGLGVVFTGRQSR